MTCRMLLLLPLLALAACRERTLPNQEMIDLLKESAKNDHNHENVFSPEAMVEYCDSMLKLSSGGEAERDALSRKAGALLQLGQEQKAIGILETLLEKTSAGEFDQRQAIKKDLAIAWLRLGD